MEPDVRRVLLGVVEMPGVTRHEHRRAFVVFGHGGAVGVDEGLHLGRGVGVDPARGVKLRRLEMHRHVVFRADAVGQDVELQTADNTDNPIGTDGRFENTAEAKIMTDYFDGFITPDMKLKQAEPAPTGV